MGNRDDEALKASGALQPDELTKVIGCIRELIRLSFDRDPTLRPEFDARHRLLVVSDYGGQHGASESRFAIYSYLITTSALYAPVSTAVSKWRNDFLADGREMCFKSLRDKKRALALPDFLSIVASLDGIVVSVAIDKKLGRCLAARPTPQDVEGVPLAAIMARYVDNRYEHCTRVTRLCALMVSVFSQMNQDVLWLTDRDVCADSSTSTQDTAHLLEMLFDSFVPHQLGQLDLETDGESPNLRDLTAVPDLCAGALASLLHDSYLNQVDRNVDLTVPLRSTIPEKARRIAEGWLLGRRSLRQLVICAELDAATGKPAIGTRSYVPVPRT